MLARSSAGKSMVKSALQGAITLTITLANPILVYDEEREQDSRAGSVRLAD